jgi:hypothetical protein
VSLLLQKLEGQPHQNMLMALWCTGPYLNKIAASEEGAEQGGYPVFSKQVRNRSTIILH